MILTPFLVGQEADDVEALNEAMAWHIHYVGRGGCASFAISAIDIALWDIRCKTMQQPLWKLAGGASNRCGAYCGGIDLNFSLDKLLKQTENYLSRGFNGVKIKVGQETLVEDVQRVDVELSSKTDNDGLDQTSNVSSFFQSKLTPIPGSSGAMAL